MRTRLTSSSDPVPSLAEPSRQEGHRSVLLHEVVRALDVREDDIVVDATLGGGGHARKLVKGLGGNGLFIGFDADADAIARTQKALAGERVQTHLVHANFRDMVNELERLGVSRITKALFDLGWSSYQLDSGRGFSFKADEPLAMTYQTEIGHQTVTAATVVNTWSEKTLADIIYGFGEERYSRRIAKLIVERRSKKPIRTSRELAGIIAEAVPAGYRRGKLHPATRTFQALRIAVNDEFGALSAGLSAAWKLLVPGGRIAVISFHSAEDRIVKRTFAAWAKNDEGMLYSKKPIVPSAEELRENPRARSAKLRVIEKL